MGRLLTTLGIDLPVLAAPMAGGAGTVALVNGAARAGGLGFLAAGYLTPQTLTERIAAMRAHNVPFGVNLFAPNPIPVSAAEFRRYAETLDDESRRYGLTTREAEPVEDDDHWNDKLDFLLSEPVPLVSFTFGLADRGVVAALRRAGSLVMQTVTSVDEARAAAGTGVDGLIVQAAAAGGHSATFDPARPLPVASLVDLVAAVRHAVTVPVIAAGGIATAAGATAAVGAGAEAAMVGTVLLRTDESGASDPHKTAIGDQSVTATVMTHGFTGRPARALCNRFTRQYGPLAPLGYPAVHHLTSPLRKAATAAGDTDLIHMWAGTGYRHARIEPVAQTLNRLAGDL